MCCSYSNLGGLDREENEYSILLAIWMVFNFRRRTPVLLHENVKGFLSCLVVEEAMKAGYSHTQIICNPKDVGIPVGRPRKRFGQWRSANTFPTGPVNKRHYVYSIYNTDMQNKHAFLYLSLHMCGTWQNMSSRLQTPVSRCRIHLLQSKILLV